MYCIAYPPGAYGNFIGWTLEWLQGKYPVEYRPFKKTSDSDSNVCFNNHAWKRIATSGAELTAPDGAEQACSIAQNGVIVHPIQTAEQLLTTQIKLLHTVYDKIIYLYPELNDFVWHLNNKNTKVYADGWLNHNDHLLTDNKNNWEQYGKWQHREHLSLWWHNQNFTEVQYNEIDLLDNSYVKPVPINQIRDNFVNLVAQLSQWLELEIVVNNDQIRELHNDWLQREIFAYKDKLILDLVDAIINDIELDMINLTIVDECEIQRQLRVKGYEIKCYGLDDWPKTTTQLRELIYET